MAETLAILNKNSNKKIYTSNQIQYGATASDWYQYSIYDDAVVFMTINVASVRSTGKLFDVPATIKPKVNVYANAGTSYTNMGTVGILTNGEVDVWSSSLSGSSVSMTYLKA